MKRSVVAVIASILAAFAMASCDKLKPPKQSPPLPKTAPSLP